MWLRGTSGSRFFIREDGREYFNAYLSNSRKCFYDLFVKTLSSITSYIYYYGESLWFDWSRIVMERWENNTSDAFFVIIIFMNKYLQNYI